MKEGRGEEGEFEERTKVQLRPAKHIAAVVICVEVHVKHVDIAVTLVVQKNCCGDSTLRPSFSVRLGTLEPCWILGHIVVGSEEDIAA